MSITAEQIKSNFEQIARDLVAYYYDNPLPSDPVESAWLMVCKRLVATLDTLPNIIPWENNVQILDMFRWVRPEIREQMAEQDHPFYLAWVDVKQELGL